MLRHSGFPLYILCQLFRFNEKRNKLLIIIYSLMMKQSHSGKYTHHIVFIAACNHGIITN